MNQYKRMFQKAFEEANQEKPVINGEHEVAIYGKIGDFDGLQTADSKESHEQWEIKVPKGRVRVRKTAKDGLAPTFSLTFKTKTVSMGINGNEEKTFDISEEMFQSFKALSDQGMIKDRYLFPVNMVQVSNASGVQDIHIPDMNYEVDVFYSLDHDGNKSYKPWAKVDLELDPLMLIIQRSHPDIGEFNLNIKASKLPIDLTEVMISTDEDPVTKERISRLYDEFFLTKK